MMEEEVFSVLDLELEDKNNLNNPQFVSFYARDITTFCCENGKKTMSRFGYLDIQKDINEKMRAILVDWLVDVHSKFKLRSETLFLTVNLIDRYLNEREVSRQKLQLVGVACMLIACKYEEIYAPEVKDFVYITDNAYDREEVLEMEGKILEVLKFNLLTHSANFFLERFAQLTDCTEKALMLARYLLELSLVEYKMIKFSPIHLASSAVYLSKKLFKLENPWTDTLQRNTNMTEAEVRICAKDMCLLLQYSDKNNLQAVKRKFSTPKFLGISKVQLEKK